MVRLTKSSLQPYFQESSPGVEQVPPIQTNKSRVGQSPRWERHRTASSTNSLENESNQGLRGTRAGSPPYRLTRPRAPGTEEELTLAEEHSLSSLCPSLLHSAAFLKFQDLSLREFYCSYSLQIPEWISKYLWYSSLFSAFVQGNYTQG